MEPSARSLALDFEVRYEFVGMDFWQQVEDQVVAARRGSPVDALARDVEDNADIDVGDGCFADSRSKRGQPALRWLFALPRCEGCAGSCERDGVTRGGGNRCAWPEGPLFGFHP